MFEWWQILIIMSTGVVLAGVLILVAVFLGGILVFKTKTITMPTPFFNETKQKTGKATSYVSDLYNESLPDLLDDTLSPAAARLREQKKVEDIDNHKTLMERITGKK